MAEDLLASLCLDDLENGKDREIVSLETTGLCCAKPAIDALPDESTHVVFSLQTGCEAATAGELGIGSVFKVDVTFPRPRACRAVLINDPAEQLFTIGFLYGVSGFFWSRFHSR